MVGSCGIRPASQIGTLRTPFRTELTEQILQTPTICFNLQFYTSLFAQALRWWSPDHDRKVALAANSDRPA